MNYYNINKAIDNIQDRATLLKINQILLSPFLSKEEQLQQIKKLLPEASASPLTSSLITPQNIDEPQPIIDPNFFVSDPTFAQPTPIQPDLLKTYSTIQPDLLKTYPPYPTTPTQTQIMPQPITTQPTIPTQLTNFNYLQPQPNNQIYLSKLMNKLGFKNILELKIKQHKLLNNKNI